MMAAENERIDVIDLLVEHDAQVVTCDLLVFFLFLTKLAIFL